MALKHYKGKDATDAFLAFHPPNDPLITSRLKAFKVGTLESPAPNESNQELKRHESISSNYRILYRELEQEGLFITNPWFYMIEMTRFLLLWGLTIWLVLKGGMEIEATCKFEYVGKMNIKRN